MTQTLTAEELLRTDAGFRTLCSLWWAEKEIPVVIQDYLMDRDLGRQAAAVRWMLEQPKKVRDAVTDATLLPPLPYDFASNYNDWAWGIVEDWGLRCACHIPSALFSDALCENGTSYMPSKIGPEHAICMALDAWKGESL